MPDRMHSTSLLTVLPVACWQVNTCVVSLVHVRLGADAVMRQQHKRTKSSKKRDALGQWVQVRRPSAFGHTQADQHR